MKKAIRKINNVKVRRVGESVEVLSAKEFKMSLANGSRMVNVGDDISDISDEPSKMVYENWYIPEVDDQCEGCGRDIPYVMVNNNPLLVNSPDSVLIYENDEIIEVISREEFDSEFELLLNKDSDESKKFTIETFKDSSGEHRCRVRSINGNIVMDSGEGYSSKQMLEKTLVSFVEAVLQGNISVKETKSDE